MSRIPDHRNHPEPQYSHPSTCKETIELTIVLSLSEGFVLLFHVCSACHLADLASRGGFLEKAIFQYHSY
jgi:hypothetical protein